MRASRLQLAELETNLAKLQAKAGVDHPPTQVQKDIIDRNDPVAALFSQTDLSTDEGIARFLERPVPKAGTIKITTLQRRIELVHKAQADLVRFMRAGEQVMLQETKEYLKALVGIK